MIKKLTKKQQAKLKVYREKYIKYGLSTAPINKKFAQKIMNQFYEQILKIKSVKIIICDNPLQAYYMCCFYKILKLKLLKNKYKTQEVGQEVWKEVWKEIWQEVDREVSQEIWQEVDREVDREVSQEVWQEIDQEVSREVSQEVRQEIWKEVDREVWKKVNQEVDREVDREVRQEIWKEVDREVSQEIRKEVNQEVSREVWKEVSQEVSQEVWKEVRNKIRKYWYPYLCGSFDSNFYSIYDYLLKECNINYKCKKKYNLYSKLINFNFIYCLKNICFMSQKPIKIFKNNKGQLHADKKPALEYKGLKLWRLNGVKVPEYIVMTPYHKLDAQKILQEKNAEVRREGIRKIGIHNCIEQLNPIVMDKKENYELLKINFTDNNRIYIKMKNPSIDTWHIEAVHPLCDTIDKALAWRDNEYVYVKPDILT